MASRKQPDDSNDSGMQSGERPAKTARGRPIAEGDVGPLDPLIVGWAHVVYERGERVSQPLL
jgi:hypothetical protein